MFRKNYYIATNEELRKEKVKLTDAKGKRLQSNWKSERPSNYAQLAYNEGRDLNILEVNDRRDLDLMNDMRIFCKLDEAGENVKNIYDEGVIHVAVQTLHRRSKLLESV